MDGLAYWDSYSNSNPTVKLSEQTDNCKINKLAKFNLFNFPTIFTAVNNQNHHPSMHLENIFSPGNRRVLLKSKGKLVVAAEFKSGQSIGRNSIVKNTKKIF